MLMGEVVGSVVSTRKHDGLLGNKLLIVEELECMDINKKRLIAVDTVGAGVGEIVLIVTGSSARKSVGNHEAPIDAAIIGIVDDQNNISLSR